MSGEEILQVSYHAIRNSLQRALNSVLEAGSKSERLIPEYHDFIPYNPDRVRDELSFTAETCHSMPDLPRRFLDVGCGPGNVMLVAGSFGFLPFGIEYNPALVKRAPYPQHERYSPVEKVAGIYQQDAFKFRNYGDFDVVYLYCPIANSSLEARLEQLIESQLKEGAIYIVNLKQDRSIMKNPDFEYIGADKKLPVWRKIS